MAIAIDVIQLQRNSITETNSKKLPNLMVCCRLYRVRLAVYLTITRAKRASVPVLVTCRLLNVSIHFPSKDSCPQESVLIAKTVSMFS